ncbi:MAG: hypothetical protein CL933_03050 [Deltaproteobacteria bacterium]|nr:hypothetical protein [Deltaproteobacteria bacterium]
MARFRTKSVSSSRPSPPESPRDSARRRRLDSHGCRGIAAQLAIAGIGRGRGRKLQVAPLLYQCHDIWSPFGREIAFALESAIGRTPVDPAADATGIVVIRGTYREGDADFQLRLGAKEAETGALLASAEISLAKAGVPSDMKTRPANFDRFIEDADKLAGDDIVSGDLRVDLRTNKRSQGIVFDEGEELTVYVRVNQPTWTRLIYVLTDGDHVPITQEWFVDESKVNQLVEYPISSEIVAPFGVEMIHAMASTEKPPKLLTSSTVIDGEAYPVIRDGADQGVHTRGLARKKKQRGAEQTLHLTTMRAPRPTHEEPSLDPLGRDLRESAREPRP